MNKLKQDYWQVMVDFARRFPDAEARDHLQDRVILAVDQLLSVLESRNAAEQAVLTAAVAWRRASLALEAGEDYATTMAEEHCACDLADAVDVWHGARSGGGDVSITEDRAATWEIMVRITRSIRPNTPEEKALLDVDAELTGLRILASEAATWTSAYRALDNADCEERLDRQAVEDSAAWDLVAAVDAWQAVQAQEAQT